MPLQSTALAKEISSIRTSFKRLARSFGRIGPLLSASAVASLSQTTEGARTRRRPRLTVDQRRALKLQGKYMGTMRGLRPEQRNRIKKVRAQKGIHAAIRAAQKLVADS